MLEFALENWASELGVKLVNVEPGPWKKVEMISTPTRTEQTFRITIQTGEGKRRSGQAKCIETVTFWKSDVQVDVCWDEER